MTFAVTYIDRNGVRVSTEAAYLTPYVLARPNLKVVTKARVTRIHFSNFDGTLHATGVEFAAFNRMEADKKFNARAKKEVIVWWALLSYPLERKPTNSHGIVSCGTIHTPQLLMLSGIGPASHLAEHNIPVVLDAQGVGCNLSDHPAFHLRLAEKMGISLAYLAADNKWTKFKFWRDFLQYQFMGTGPFSSNVRLGTFCKLYIPFPVIIDNCCSLAKRRPSSVPTTRISSLLQNLSKLSKTLPQGQVHLTWR